MHLVPIRSSSAEARRALRLFFQAVAEEVPEQRIVEKRMALRLDLLAGENVDDRRHGFSHGIVIGARAGRKDRRRCGLAQLDHLGGGAAEPFGLQGGDDEKRADGDGSRLGKDEPEIAQVTQTVLRKRS